MHLDLPNVIEALTILQNYAVPMGAIIDHDPDLPGVLFYVDGIRINDVTDDDNARLIELGWKRSLDGLYEFPKLD